MSTKKKTKTPLVTKREALEILSNQLRRTDLAPLVTARLSNVYAKISGWKPQPQRESKEPSLNQLVAEAERKRREGKAQ